jgi:polar amino acid transport system substrate-binding protein
MVLCGDYLEEKAHEDVEFSTRGLLACLGFLGAAATAHAATLDDIQKRGELRIAVQTQGPPFSMINKNGERTGSSVELAKLMAQEMGVKVVFLDLDWDGLLPALISGKADMLAADMTPTLARATKVAFTKPWLYIGPVVATKEGSKFNSTNACKAPAPKSPCCLAARVRSWQKPCSRKAKSKATRAAEPCCWTR